jgi:hypothetical protein
MNFGFAFFVLGKRLVKGHPFDAAHFVDVNVLTLEQVYKFAKFLQLRCFISRLGWGDV